MTYNLVEGKMYDFEGKTQLNGGGFGSEPRTIKFNAKGILSRQEKGLDGKVILYFMDCTVSTPHDQPRTYVVKSFSYEGIAKIVEVGLK